MAPNQLYTAYITDPRVSAFRIWRDDVDGETWVPAPRNDAAGEPPIHLAMIGKVSCEQHELGPLGSYSYELDNMAHAKWSFALERPTKVALATHFDAAFSILRAVQGAASLTGENRQLLVEGARQQGIRFVWPMFVDKVENRRLFKGGVQPGSGDVVQAEFLAWPVPLASASRFSSMTRKLQFSPLQVFHESGYAVAPIDMATKLPGSVVEVTFTLHHTHCDHLDCDTFSALASKVVLLDEDSPQEERLIEDAGEVWFTNIV